MYTLFILFFLQQTLQDSDYATTSYKLISYDDIVNLMQDSLQSKKYENFMRIKNVFDIYPMIKAPLCKDKKCKSYLIEITDFEKGDDYINSLPTVLIIAGFHGNEVIGTNTLYYFLQTLMNNFEKVEYFSDFIQNVRLLLLPTANVQGFYNLKREEFKEGKSLDPNRDFPFNLKSDQKCFKTTTAKIVDQIFRNNLIVTCITYHGGDNSITYPWGNFAHKDDPITGDNLAFKQIATSLQNIAGQNQKLKIQKYQTGTMQDIVYDVNGGFEDWAYGASWDTKNVQTQCNQEYQKTYSDYDHQTNRALVYLVEAGKDKIPKESSLGNELSIYDPQNDDAINGHITRNIRLIKGLIDLTYPSVTFIDIQFKGDITIELQVRGCQSLNYFDTTNVKSQIQVDNINAKINQFQVLITINKEDCQQINQVSFEYTCDQQWKQQYIQKNPQTHFLKLRTDSQYEVQFKQFSLQSQTKIKFYLLNFKIQQIDNIQAIIKINKGIYNIVYSQRLQIITKDTVQDIQLINNYTRIDKEFQVFKLTGPQEDQQYQLIQNSQKLSYQQFYSFIGKQVTINKELGIIKSNEDHLFIPTNGLISTFSDITNKVLITIIPQGLLELSVQIISKNLIDFKLKIQDIVVNFQQNQAQKFHEVYTYQTKIQTTDDNLRLFCINGAIVQIYLNSQDQPLVSTLIQNNIYVENKLQIYKSITQKTNTKNSSDNIVYTFIFILILFAFISLYYMYRTNKKRKDIQKIYSNTNFNNDEESAISIDGNKSFS